MEHTANGFMGQTWEHVQDDCSVLSLLRDDLGRWELATIVGHCVVGTPVGLGDDGARILLDSWEPGAGKAFFVAEAQRVVDIAARELALAASNHALACETLRELGGLTDA